MSTAATPFDPAVPNKSVPWMLANIWFEPARVFDQVERTPRWWVPLLIVVATALIFTAVFTKHVGWETFIRHEIETNPRLDSVPPDQREKIIEMQSRIAPIMGFAGIPASIATAAVVIAAVLMLVFKYLLDSPCGFPQALGVVSWSMLPGVLHSLAAILVMLMLPAAEFDLKNPVGTNLGYYVAAESPAWMKTLLSSVDFFSIWTILLLATGMSTLTGRSWGSALGAIVIPWGFYVVIKTAFAAVFG